VALNYSTISIEAVTKMHYMSKRSISLYKWMWTLNCCIFTWIDVGFQNNAYLLVLTLIILFGDNIDYQCHHQKCNQDIHPYTSNMGTYWFPDEETVWAQCHSQRFIWMGFKKMRSNLDWFQKRTTFLPKKKEKFWYQNLLDWPSSRNVRHPDSNILLVL
jgi:hypothetical protein